MPHEEQLFFMIVGAVDMRAATEAHGMLRHCGGKVGELPRFQALRRNLILDFAGAEFPHDRLLHRTR